MQGWLRATRVYLEPRVIVVLFLGFASGLPLLLTLSTLSFWLAEAKDDKAAIGLFALVGLPYTWKFVWAPCRPAARRSRSRFPSSLSKGRTPTARARCMLTV